MKQISGNSLYKGLIIVLFFLFFPQFMWSQRIQPLPYFLEAGELAEPLEYNRFMEIALIASGVEQQQLSAYMERFTEILRDFQHTLFDSHSDRDRAETALIYLHDNILASYRWDQTRVDVLFDSGFYNCVSSAVIYMAMLKSLGIYVQGEGTSEHAFCTVPLGGQVYDVETTIRFGFDPGRRQEFSDELTNRTGFVYVPASNYSDRQSVGDKRMLAYILHNRIAGLQRRNRYEQALELAADYSGLVRGPSGSQVLKDSVVNLAASHTQRRNNLQAIELLTRYSELRELDPDMQKVYDNIVYNQIAHFLNQNQGETAHAAYEEALTQGVISPEMSAEIEQITDRWEIADAVRNGSFEVAVPLVESGRQNGILEQAAWQEFSTVLYGNQAVRLVEEQGEIAAIEFLEAASVDIRRLTGIRSLLNNLKHNLAVSIHNRFVSLWNNGETENAIEYLREGLRALPDSVTLQQDLRQATRQKSDDRKRGRKSGKAKEDYDRFSFLVSCM